MPLYMITRSIGRMKKAGRKTDFHSIKIPSISFIPYSCWENTVFNRDILPFEIIRDY